MPHVLLVEDSPTQAQRLALILEEAGFAVETAPNAARGFERLVRGRFDLVLSDLLLPGDSGFDLSRRIKADARFRHLPVVVLTSQADPANVLRGLEAGADGFLTKDREPEEIVGCLQRALARQAPTQAAGATPSRVVFLNQEYALTADRERLLDVLVTAFEDVVHLNERNEASAAALREANAALEERNRRLQQLADELAAAALSERRAHEELKKTEGQLVQSEKMASLGQMVAGIAHEINNPIAFVTNNLAVLHRDVLAAMNVLEHYREGRTVLAGAAPDLAAALDRLEEEMDLPYLQANLPRLFEKSLAGLKRVRDIVTNLRDFARLDEAEFKEVDLNAALASTVEILRHEIKTKEIQLQIPNQELPPILCHPGKINQVFLNLLLNAFQACERGGMVEVRTRLEPGEAVVVEVADNGCGIKPEHLPHLFEPFFTTKPVGQGTGLGLSVSYGIIRDHGGAITAESTPGQGSTFRIRLPLQPPRPT
jgi:signal transduction histidine kinase